MESESTTQMDLEEENDGQLRQIDDESDSDDSPTVEEWHEVVDAVIMATREAFPSSPAFDQDSPGTFQGYWKDIFTRLLESITSNADIPNFLSSPPSESFKINLFTNVHAGGCPCCLPDVEPSITLRNENGVTKVDFIRGLTEHLYGVSPPMVYDEAEWSALSSSASKSKFGALVFKGDWMSSGSSPEGKKYSYCRRDELTIWLYCCEADEFKEKIRAKIETTKSIRSDSS